MVLTGLLFKCFFDNLLNFPNHVIHVRKEDVLNIKSIDFTYKYSAVNLTSSSTIDLSKLVNLNLVHKIEYTSMSERVKFNIEGLTSLETLFLRLNTEEFEFSIKNLPSLTSVCLSISILGTIDENIVTRLLDQMPHIQELCLHGNLFYFNLDNLVNLKKLTLDGIVNPKFNFELFKNLCNQLESIKIRLFNEKSLLKLFDGCYNFPYLADFTLMSFKTKRLKKEFMNGFSTLRQLTITDCNIKVIKSDSFSSMQQLTSLDLSNNKIESIKKNAFSSLKNLQTIDLSYNKLIKFDRNFIGLGNSVEVNI